MLDYVFFFFYLHTFAIFLTLRNFFQYRLTWPILVLWRAAQTPILIAGLMDFAGSRGSTFLVEGVG